MHVRIFHRRGERPPPARAEAEGADVAHVGLLHFGAHHVEDEVHVAQFGVEIERVAIVGRQARERADARRLHDDVAVARQILGRDVRERGGAEAVEDERKFSGDRTCVAHRR